MSSLLSEKSPEIRSAIFSTSDPYLQYCLSIYLKDSNHEKSLELMQLAAKSRDLILSSHAKAMFMYLKRIAANDAIINHNHSEADQTEIIVDEKLIKHILKNPNSELTIEKIRKISKASYSSEKAKTGEVTQNKLFIQDKIAGLDGIWPINNSEKEAYLALILYLPDLALATDLSMTGSGFLLLFADPSIEPGADGRSNSYSLKHVIKEAPEFEYVQKFLKQSELNDGTYVKFKPSLSLSPMDYVCPSTFMGREQESYQDLIERIEEVIDKGCRPACKILGFAERLQGWDEPLLFESEDGEVENFVLLFQVESQDSSSEFCWGGSSNGRLYVWIKETDLKYRAFEKARFSIEYT